MAIFTEAEAKFDTIDAKLTNLFAQVEVLTEKGEAQEIDYDSLADEIDTGSLVQELDYGQIAGEIHMGDLATEFADNINIRDIANEIDLDDLASKVSDEVMDRLSDIPALEQIESRLTAIENGHPIGNPDKVEAAVADTGIAQTIAERLNEVELCVGDQRLSDQVGNKEVVQVLRGELEHQKARGNERYREAVVRILTLEAQVKELQQESVAQRAQVQKLLNFFKAFGALTGV